MAIIPLVRVIIFVLITILSLVVLGLCAHIEWLIFGYVDIYSSFVPLGLGVSSLSIVSLPLFLALGNMRRVCTSTIIFEIIWFFILWMLWAGTAGDTVAGKAYYYPGGCSVLNDYDYYVDPAVTQICSEITAIEVFAFVNFLCAFIYYDVIFLYAIINAIRGRGVWTVSVKEAATGVLNPGVAMVQPQFHAPPAMQYQSYSAYPSNVPPTQSYSVPPQQVPFQSPPAQAYTPYPQPGIPQGLPAQPYHAYPQPMSPQSPPPQQYNAYLQQSPQAPVPPAQSQPYNYAPAPGSQQQVNYAAHSLSPTANNASLPPQPNYGSHPTNGPQAPLPLPSGYQSQDQPQLPSPYGP